MPVFPTLNPTSQSALKCSAALDQIAISWNLVFSWEHLNTEDFHTCSLPGAAGSSPTPSTWGVLPLLNTIKPSSRWLEPGGSRWESHLQPWAELGHGKACLTYSGSWPGEVSEGSGGIPGGRASPLFARKGILFLEWSSRERQQGEKAVKLCEVY